MKELEKWCKANNIKFYHKTWLLGNPGGELLAEMPDGHIYRRTPVTETNEFKRDLENHLKASL